MPRLKKRIYDFDESINDFMIYCTNKDLTKKTMKSYEGTLKLFAKYLADEVNIFTPKDVTTKHIKDYLEFTKTKGKYSYVVDINSLKSNNPSARRDFGKQISLHLLNIEIMLYYNFLWTQE